MARRDGVQQAALQRRNRQCSFSSSTYEQLCSPLLFNALASDRLALGGPTAVSLGRHDPSGGLLSVRRHALCDRVFRPPHTSRPPRSWDARHSVILRTLWDIGRAPGDCWVGTACHRAGRGRDRHPPQGRAASGLHTRRGRREGVGARGGAGHAGGSVIHGMRTAYMKSAAPSGAPRWGETPGTTGEKA
jgi:hypothetical protein